MHMCVKKHVVPPFITLLQIMFCSSFHLKKSSPKLEKRERRLVYLYNKNGSNSKGGRPFCYSTFHSLARCWSVMAKGSLPSSPSPERIIPSDNSPRSFAGFKLVTQITFLFSKSS